MPVQNIIVLLYKKCSSTYNLFYSKKKINDLLSALEGFNKVLSVVKLFQENIAEFR